MEREQARAASWLQQHVRRGGATAGAEAAMAAVAVSQNYRRRERGTRLSSPSQPLACLLKIVYSLRHKHGINEGAPCFLLLAPRSSN